MKRIIILFAITLLVSCGTQKKIVTKKVVTAQKNKRGNLVGIADKNSFMQTPYKNWFTGNYNRYKIDESTVKQIKKHLKGVTVKGFMGTWCGDSKRETPRFYKIMEAADFDFNNLELVTVNHSKRTPDNLQQGFNIFRVPTFIFYRKGKEIGRFVEHPRESLEKDILKIVSGKPYKHYYDRS